MKRRANGHAGLDDLIGIAHAIEDELAALGPGRISGRGLLQASLDAHGLTLADVSGYAAEIMERPADYEASLNFAGAVAAYVMQPSVTAPLPMAYFHAVWGTTGGGIKIDRVRSEGGDLRKLWCVGVMMAVERNPGAFGEIDDMQAHQAARAALEERLARAKTAVEQADLNLHRDLVWEGPREAKGRDTATNREITYFLAPRYRIAPSVALGQPVEDLLAAVRQDRTARAA